MVALIVAVFVALATTFSLGPIFEGPDEIEHYRYVRILAQTGAFPDPYTQPEGELFQAPLYYLLATPLKLAVDDAGFEDIDGRRNPYHGYQIGIPSNDNKNVYLHTRAERFPYRDSGVARAVHVMRLLSIALGASTVVASYAIFRLLWPERPDRRLAALGFVALWPQFLYMSSVASNDTLLYLLTTLAILLLLRQQRDGPSWKGAVLLGGVLGAALLTEVSAVFLAIPVGVATLLDRRAWRYAALTLAVVFVVAGWWYIRNIVLYGDPTGVRAVFATWQADAIHPGDLTLGLALLRFGYAFHGAWARFGYGAVAVGRAIYWVIDGLWLLAVAGLGVWAIRARRDAIWKRPLSVGVRGAIVVGVLALTWLAALAYWSATVWTGNQGRLLLSAVAAWGAILAFGLDSLTPRRLRVPFALAGAALVLVVTAISVFAYFFPSYRVVPAPDEIAHPLAYSYDGAAELIGIDPPQPHGRPGDTVWVTLVWRALQPTQRSLQTYLHSLDSDVVRRDSLPATGNLLSTDWLPGQTWAETYVLVIPEDAGEQVAYPLVAGLYDPLAGESVPAQDADGDPVTPVVGRLAVNAARKPFEPDYRFGDVIGLAEPGVTVTGDRVEVCLRWLSLAPADIDYTVFVHLLAGGGEPLVQADFQPKEGAYPTGAWTPGESIAECVTLDAAGLPEDGWQVGIGLYDAQSGLRLPVQAPDGSLLADGMLLLAGG